MTYYIVRRWGSDTSAVSIDEMQIALAELDVQDEEHPDTWLTHESGWTLACHENGLVRWDNLDEGDECWHLESVSRSEMLNLWIKLSEGKIDDIKTLNWIPGNGYRPPTAEQLQEISQWVLEGDRLFFDALVRQSDIQCQAPGCSRKAIVRSVMCRVHHFEMIRNKPCPFDDL